MADGAQGTRYSYQMMTWGWGMIPWALIGSRAEVSIPLGRHVVEGSDETRSPTLEYVDHGREVVIEGPGRHHSSGEGQLGLQSRMVNRDPLGTRVNNL